MSDVLKFPTFHPYGPRAREARQRLAKMFAGKDAMAMRHMWDHVGDDSFYHAPDGSMYDCADIHGYMNMLGDGKYCAV